MTKFLSIFLVVSALLIAVVIATPGQLMGAEEEDSIFGTNGQRGPAQTRMLDGEDPDEIFEKRDELRLKKIEQLKEEGVLTEDEAQELEDAIEERASFERGTCLEYGERNCDLNLNLRGRTSENENEETSRGFGFGRKGLGHGHMGPRY